MNIQGQLLWISRFANNIERKLQTTEPFDSNGQTKRKVQLEN